MTFTPIKNRGGGKKTPAKPDYREVDRLRRQWIAALPVEIDTDAVGTLDHAQSLTFAWNVAGCARLFMEWTNFQPANWQPWAGYQERLAKICHWLSQQPTETLPYRRDDALSILQQAWQAYQAIRDSQDSELLFDTIPSLWLPDDEFGPLALEAPLPYLPVWQVQPQDPSITPEREAQRWAAARVGEEFTLYSGLTTYLNLKIGLQPLDLGESPF